MEHILSLVGFSTALYGIYDVVNQGVQVRNPEPGDNIGNAAPGGKPSAGSPEGDAEANIPKKGLDELPHNARDAYENYDKSGWKGNTPGQTQGTAAGGKYQNRDGKLPPTDSGGNPITYKEWDVNNKQPGATRDGERFVTGSDGSVYYTDSHYGEGSSPTGSEPFVKIR